MTLEHVAEERLKALTDEDARNWVKIGHTLFDLEASSRSAPSGRAWQDVLSDRLVELEAPISPSHLYKIRRAYRFLHDQAHDALESGMPYPPKISSIEIAERLFRLNPDAGKQALRDALAPQPTPYVELKARYDQALKSSPEMKSPRQIAWEARRRNDGAASTHVEASPTSPAAPSAKASVAPQEPMSSGPSAGLRHRSEDLLEAIWQQGWQAAESRYMSELEELRTTVAEQADTIATNEEEISLLQAECQSLAKMVREYRGYYPEDFKD